MKRSLAVAAVTLVAVVAVAYVLDVGPFANSHRSAIEAAMQNQPPQTITRPDGTTITLPMTEEQWKKVLTPEQFAICRGHGTERACSADIHNSKQPGVYSCVACGLELFTSEHKFDSGTGWPSYFQPIDEQRIGRSIDNSWFMTRTEVHCNRCGSHLGHLFEDGPAPTGLRYCINGVALNFTPKAVSPSP